jgi:hypothetical protein
MIQLGVTVRDKITGFSGVVTGRAEYISGCTQCLVCPRVKDDGGMQDAHWFDEQRLLVDAGCQPVTLDNGATPGPDKPAPVR